MLCDVVCRRRRRRRWAHAPVIHAASHFDHKKRVAWVPISMHTCGSFFYNYGAPLGGPSGRRSSAINAQLNITPPHLQHSHGENLPHLNGLPGNADRATRPGEVPHLSCESSQEKKRDCMERLVTPPKRGTSPSWAPPPPCEQALSFTFENFMTSHTLYTTKQLSE